MSTMRQRLRHWGWRQWTLTVCAVLYLIYIALSYLYLPGKLKEVVQTDVAQLLGRDIQVQEFFFNPFTLSLTTEQFVIADRPDLPLLAWDRLFVNFDALGSLFGWQIRFSTVQLEAPRIAIERRKDDFNFSSIVTRLSANETPAPQPESKTAIALKIDDIQILDGLFTFDDISGARPAHSSMDEITLAVKNLYLATGDDKLNPLSLEASMPRGGQLKLSGKYRADPLKVDLNITANDIHLEAFKDFIANQVPLQLNNGRLSLQADVDMEMNQALQVLVRNGQLGVTDLVLDDSTQEPPLLRGKQFQLQGINMNLAQRSFRIEGIDLEGFSTDQWLDNEGQPRIQPLLASSNKASEEPPATTDVNTDEVKSWDFSIGTVSLQNTEVGFTDRRDGLNAVQQIGNLNIVLNDIHLIEGEAATLQLSANLNDAGDLKVDGQIVPIPFALDLNYKLQSLGLTPFNPYLEQLSWLRVQQGKLNVDGGVKMHSAEPLPLTLDLYADVSGLKVQDSRTGDTVVQWKALQVEMLNLDLAQRTVAIDKVTLTAPDVALEIDADKQMNLATLMKSATAVDAPTKTENAEAPNGETTADTDMPPQGQAWDVAINQIRIKDGSTRFHDASIKPVFKTGLYTLDLKMDRFSSTGKKPASFTLTSKLDKYAPFTVKGTLAPLQQQPGFVFTSKLSGLEMPSLSPYSGTYIGNNLKSGQLTLDLQYDVKQQALQGKNNIVATQLYLGDAVQSEQATSLPVGLGLALLRDANGVIDLNLDVSGDLNDPSFSVAGIVWKALTNIIVKAVTSPFKLLASLVGSTEDLGSISFNAGESQLTPDDQNRLQQLVKALMQRPQLAVTVHGSADAKDDNAALQQQRVLDQIATLRKVPVSGLQFTSLLDDKANHRSLEQLNTALKLPAVRLREKALKKADPKIQADALRLQVFQQMLADVTDRQSISQQDLLTLADQRALAIKQYLVETARLDHNRVKLEKTREEDLKGLACELGVEPR